MGIKDVFSGQKLSAIGQRLKAAGAKVGGVFRRKPRAGSTAGDVEPTLTPEATEAAQAQTSEPTGTPEVPAVNEEHTDPLIQAPPQGNAFQRFVATTRNRLSNLAANTKTQAATLARQLKENFPKDIDDLKKIQPDELLERMRQLTGGRASGLYLRLAAAGTAAYFMADTVSLMTDSLVPDPPVVPAPIVRHLDEKHRSSNEYAAIVDRDIFSSSHTIPTGGTRDGIARKTNLPLVLIGTVVLKNEAKSIATIEDRSQNMIFPVRVEDVVNNQIQITRIEHLKVTFVNMSTGNLEYVEIVEDVPAVKLETTHSAPAKGEGGITKTDDTHVQVDARVISDGMGNLNEVLQQARAIPNFENGMPNGYKILQIVPNSIFDKFGIKNNDVITGLNGESVNDPGKALSMLNDLPNARHVEITVLRGGRKMTMNYDIH